jgi:putative hydrolase of HD superfamily
MKEQLQKILHLLSLAEKLKCELRHGWTSNGRQESVAEHVWRVSLMAILFAPYLKKEIHLSKTLKMIIIHDLVEAEAGDIPIFEAEKKEIKEQKILKEKAAIERIREILGSPVGDEIYDLWSEFEEEVSNEARFAQALDKLEAQLQHNEADISTWLEVERTRVFYKLDRFGQFDEIIQLFVELLKEQAVNKMKKAKIDVDALQQQALFEMKKGEK